MTIRTEKEDPAGTAMFLEGRFDTAASPLFEKQFQEIDPCVTQILLDFGGMSYISSMGLRVLLQANKEMAAKGGKMIIRNMPEQIRNIFEMTGFIELFELVK
jgi:anti-sigma B factor antagonist